MTGGKKKIKFAEVNFLSLADIFRQKLYRREKTNVKNVFLKKKKHVDFYSCHLLSHIHLSFFFKNFQVSLELPLISTRSLRNRLWRRHLRSNLDSMDNTYLEFVGKLQVFKENFHSLGIQAQKRNSVSFSSSIMYIVYFMELFVSSFWGQKNENI